MNTSPKEAPEEAQGAAANGDFTIGVEEEYQIVDASTGGLRPRAERILPKAQREVGDEVTNELYLSQIEIGTPVCRTLQDVRAELVRLRRALIQAAERSNSRIAATATHPFSHWEDQQITPKARYIGIWQNYQQLAREHLINGCHVHIGICDPEMAIQVMNRVRPHLAPILALSANSPYWLGADTGYASYRTEIFGRWTFAGTPHVFNSRKDYDELVDALVKTESIEDATKIYWDVRPSGRFETLEFRVADVCLTIDEAVMIAGLCQALARTVYAEVQRNTAIKHARPELLRAAKWRAARYGLDADLILVADECAAPAREVIANLLDYVRPALEESGEWAEVSALVDETFARGNGATRQRAAYATNESYEDVVDFIIAETKQGID